MKNEVKEMVIEGLMLYSSANSKRKALYKESLTEKEIPNLERMMIDPYYNGWNIADKIQAANILLRALNIYKNDLRLY